MTVGGFAAPGIFQRLLAASRCIFPLEFSRQSRDHERAIRLGLMVVHAVDRMVASIAIAAVTGGSASSSGRALARIHALLPRAHRDFGLVETKRCKPRFETRGFFRIVMPPNPSFAARNEYHAVRASRRRSRSCYGLPFGFLRHSAGTRHHVYACITQTAPSQGGCPLSSRQGNGVVSEHSRQLLLYPLEVTLGAREHEQQPLRLTLDQRQIQFLAQRIFEQLLSFVILAAIEQVATQQVPGESVIGACRHPASKACYSPVPVRAFFATSDQRFDGRDALRAVHRQLYLECPPLVDVECSALNLPVDGACGFELKHHHPRRQGFVTVFTKKHITILLGNVTLPLSGANRHPKPRALNMAAYQAIGCLLFLVCHYVHAQLLRLSNLTTAKAVHPIPNLILR